MTIKETCTGLLDKQQIASTFGYVVFGPKVRIDGKHNTIKGFDGHAGEVYFEKTDSSAFVFAETDGNQAADLVILLDDAIKLEKGDFML